MNQDFLVEKELIDKYSENRKELTELEYIRNVRAESLTADDKKRLGVLEGIKYELAEKLRSLTSRPVTEIKKQILIRQIKVIVDALKEGPHGWRISRSQGLITESAIFIFVMRDIAMAFDLINLIWFIPHYYYSPNSTFDHSELKDCLVNYREKLLNDTQNNYIELESLLMDCIRSIQDIMNRDYKENVLKKG
jgi:hypothetical protein